MVDITLRRGTATRPGPDIIEPLLAVDAAAVDRGRYELNEGSLHTEVTVQVRYQPAIRVGQYVSIVDVWQGQYTALVTAVTHNVGAGTITTTLDLWKPL